MVQGWHILKINFKRLKYFQKITQNLNVILNEFQFIRKGGDWMALWSARHLRPSSSSQLLGETESALDGGKTGRNALSAAGLTCGIGYPLWWLLAEWRSAWVPGQQAPPPELHFHAAGLTDQVDYSLRQQQ